MAAVVEHRSGTPVPNTVTLPPVPVEDLRKRKAMVLCEVDAGQPCLECGPERCPGFQAHPWRCICVNCKCARNEHDLFHKDFVNVWDRLGWEPPEEPALRVCRERTLEEGYTWVPPGLTSEKINEYMDQLENPKVPLRDSQGAQYRARQLILQLPKQDFSADHCHEVTAGGQTSAFGDFRTQRDNLDMDVAVVVPLDKQDGVCHLCDGEMEPGDLVVHTEHMENAPDWHPACFVCSVCDELLVDLVYCHKENRIYCQRHYAETIRPRCAACDEVHGEGAPKRPAAAAAAKRRSPSPPKPAAQSRRRTSIPHVWEETLVSTTEGTVGSAPKQIHTPEEELHRQAMLHCVTGPPEDHLSRVSLIFSGEYTKAMEQDFHTGHFSCWNCDLSLTGHRYILREDHPFCIKCYENLFANACEECKKPIGTDSKDLSYKEKHWHETCFKCCDCQRSLVDQPFASKEERLYCADCHDNNFAARCDGCGNIFRAGMKKFEFRGKQWHEECFCCSVCKQPIGNKRFIPRENEYVCVPCYEEQFAQRCLKCNGVINKGGITYKTHPFHRDCFTCTNCNKILAGEKFTSRDDAPYCADCFGELFAKKCCRCTRPITGLGGTKFISFDDRHWHSDCFGCYRCNASLVGRGFLTHEMDILCPECGKTM